MEGVFDLSVNFSLYNGAVVLETSRSSVKIGLRDVTDEKLKEKLVKSLRNYSLRHGCKDGLPDCEFVEIDEETLRHEISLRYGQREREHNIAHEESEAGMLLDTLLKEAASKGATDVHIEERRVRFRIAGILSDFTALSSEKSHELVRRIKVLANLNVLESRRAQDGQFVFPMGTPVFVRVSCIPAFSETGSAESVVLRLLNAERTPLSLMELGFTCGQRDILISSLKKEQGLVLICGATGSGKSTTAASLIMELGQLYGNKKKIITIEDPPEYVLPGVTQIQVNEELGMSFSDALRFVFRQDPDVIFVGEIRDSLSARTVLQASLTGHLVLATVHTGGFRETAVRMKELGVDVSEFSSVLQAVIFQKLRSEDGKTVCLEAQISKEFKECA